MKLRYFYIFLFAAVCMVVLQSRSAGPAAQGLGDRTGSPVGGGSGCSCHGGGSFSPTTTVEVKDGGGNVVTEYVPGQAYTLEVTVTAGTGSPSGYGMQTLAIGSSAGFPNAGTMGTPTTPNSNVFSSGGRSYFEQQGTNAAGFFSVPWTAPASGFGSVEFYSRGLVVNANGGTSGDQQAVSVMITLTEAIPTTISYSQPTFCEGAADPTPAVTGTQGGSFTSQPAGLTINGGTGTVDISASSLGNYTITYTYGSGDSTSTAFALSANDSTTITYSASSYCQGATNPSPFIGGTTNGSFSATPTGMVINSITGEVDLANSAAGTYDVIFTTSGTCPGEDTFAIVVETVDDASFTYGTTSYCTSTTTTSPTISGTAGGSFSETSGTNGLDLNATSGDIDLSNSAPGSYTVTYTTNGTCPASSSEVITIGASIEDSTFMAICATDSVFAGGAWQDQPGTYVDSFTAVGGCDSVVILDLTVSAEPFAGTSAPGPHVICSHTGTIDLLDYLTGEDANGTWVDLDASGGLNGSILDPAVVVAAGGGAGIYDFQYTVSGNGICPDNSVIVTIEVVLCPGLSETAMNQHFSVYPNPTQNGIWIKGGDEPTEVNAYDAGGRKTKLQSVAQGVGKWKYDLSGFQTGIYILEVTSQDGTVERHRVIKQN